MHASFEGIVRDPDGRTFGVPQVELDEFHHFHLVARVNEAVERLCGTRVTTLRCLASERVDDDTRHRHYEFEAHGPVRRLAEVEVELPPPGNPWEAPGWLAAAEAWIRGRLDAPVEQRSTRSISAFLRAGDAYFKASPAIFAAEPAITQALARRHPARVPGVLDVDAERGWLLMRDFALEALRAYADLRLAWVGRGDELLALGCPDRTLPQLERELDVVLSDVDAMLPDRPAGLSVDQIAALPALRRAAARGRGAGGCPRDPADARPRRSARRQHRPARGGGARLRLVRRRPRLSARERDPDPRPGRAASWRRSGAPRCVPRAHGRARGGVGGRGRRRRRPPDRHVPRATNALAPHSRWEWETVLPWLVKQLLER